MTDAIAANTLSRADQDAVVPSAEKRLQAASIQDLGKELIDLIRQIGTSREGSIAITKVEEALHWGISHVLNVKEAGQV